MERYRELANLYVRKSISVLGGNDEGGKSKDLARHWNSLPANVRQFFEYKEEYVPVDRIAFKDLSLGNICGNSLEDDQYNLARYYETYEQLQWSGPIHWLPRRKEIDRFVKISRVVASSNNQPSILDIGCGSGFLSFLLAQNDCVKVVGVDPDVETLLLERDGIPPPYGHPNLELLPGTSQACRFIFSEKTPDVIVSSWMPAFQDLTQDIVDLNPKAIIYVYDLKYEEDRGATRATRFIPKDDYRRAFQWRGVGRDDVFGWWQFVNSENRAKHLSSADYVEFCGKNVIEVHLRNDVPNFLLEDSDSSEKYPWETTDLSQVIGPELLARFTNKADKLVELVMGLKRLMEVAPVRNFF